MKGIAAPHVLRRGILHTKSAIFVISPHLQTTTSVHHHPRLLASQTRTMTTAPAQPSFSAGEDISALQETLHPLLRANGGKWQVTATNNGLERSFKFKTFKKTWEFMNAVAAQCAAKKHHPEWSNVYNTTFIRWTTHSPPGLSSKDVLMAKFCDEQASVFGELEVEPSADAGRALADRVAVEGGDCCAPKPKS